MSGHGVAVDTLTLTAFPGYPALYGSLDFTATGGGTFEEPRYDVKWSVSDLFFGDEGIGEMTGRLHLHWATGRALWRPGAGPPHMA